MAYHHVSRLMESPGERCSPLSVVSSIAGTLNFNLVSAFEIRGASTGFVSACS